MIRAIVIDEHTADVEVLCNQLKGTESRIKVVKKFQEVSDALRYFTKFPVDLVFLNESKLEQKALLLNQGQNITFIILLISKIAQINAVRREFIEHDVQINAQNWIIQVEECRALNKQDVSLFVRADFELHQIYFKELVYAESLGDYIKFVLDGKRMLVVKMSMKALEDTLPKHSFVRVHRSYILNRGRIVKLKSKSVLVGSQEIPVGTTYLNRLQEILL
ncbi:MAG: LytTR family transcriptional regulator [Bacteroidetes bacterium]|nr:LytTR family transcriptional regulator [Bacteroidota bacterium]